MHKVGVLAAVPLLAMLNTQSFQALTVVERAEVAEAIVEWRHLVMGDNMRWDWCSAGGAFWDDSGSFVGRTEMVRSLTPIRVRSACPKVYRDPELFQSLVEVSNLTVKADSIFVYTTVTKPNAVILDEYHLLRDGVGSITVRQYRITGAKGRD